MKTTTLIILITLANLYTVAQNTYVPDDNFEQALIGLGYDDVLDDSVLTSNINTVSALDIEGLEISDLTGIEDFISLNSLNCYSNQITSFDLSSNTALQYLECSNNQLTNLNVSANTDLTYLFCVQNQLSSLDVSANTSLTSLYCYTNQLTSLDVSSNTALIFLSCFNNQITSLDLSTNSELCDLWCRYNQITSLVLPEFSSLFHIDCSHNQLTNLDVSEIDNLYELICNNNHLTGLVLTSNSVLSRLECNVNQLTNLDVRNENNQNLAIFNSENNPDLKCIYVDDKDAPFLSNWFIDPASTFVETEAECDALMIHNPEKEDGISIYPNPTEGIITIDFTEKNVLKITITDIMGREIFKKFNVSQNQDVDLSYYKSGIYILSVYKDQDVFSKKIIKR